VNGKQMQHFCYEKAVFLISFGLNLDEDVRFQKSFGLWLDLTDILKNQGWIWTAQYGSPLISDQRLLHNSSFSFAGICFFIRWCKSLRLFWLIHDQKKIIILVFGSVMWII